MELKLPTWAHRLTRSNLRHQWLAIAAILLLALVLCLYQLDTESVWIDEMLSIQGAQSFDWKTPNVRPLYYILLRFWMRFGQSDAGLRSLSVLFSLGSIFLIYRLGARMVGKGVGSIAAIAMTLSPLFLNHAQEIRMYTLSTFLTLAGTLALSSAMDAPKRSTLVGWALLRTGSMLTTPINILLLFPDSLLFGWKFRHQRRWWVAFGCGLLFIGAVFLPPALLLTTGGKADDFLQKQVADYAKPGLAQVLGMPLQFAVYYPLRYLLESHKIVLANNQLGDASLLSSFFSANALSLFFYGIVGVLLLGLMAVALVSIPRQERSDHVIALAAWALIPAAGMLCASYLKNSIWFPRYLLFIAPYFILLMAVGWVWVWQRWRMAAVAIALTYCVAVGGGLRDYYTVLYRNDWQGVAQTLQSQQKASDVLVYYSVPRFQKESLSRYYHGSIPVHFLERSGKDRELTRDAIQTSVKVDVPIPSRLWLVCWLSCQNKPEIDRVFETLVGDEFQIVDRQTFTSMENAAIEVFLVEPQSPVPLPKSSSTPPSSL
jgi:mannosyltransferase